MFLPFLGEYRKGKQMPQILSYSVHSHYGTYMSPALFFPLFQNQDSSHLSQSNRTSPRQLPILRKGKVTLKEKEGKITKMKIPDKSVYQSGYLPQITK
jgi:hypothetical protein